ncbi:MAG: DNA-deoxyinosine glycosylase [Pseudomonadales bacterium]|nr:DNA-deoxyinosine glycosylase [Pseudomonadales bacterium]
MAWAQGFTPQVDSHTRVLILGSMPGIKSLKDEQYYAHARNAFWPIITALLDVEADAEYSQRLMMLNQCGVGLWDVYHRCYRPGSLDSNIDKKSSELNDFVSLLQRYKHIRWIFFNGKAAETAFVKQVMPHLVTSLSADVFSNLHFQGLPSTSPANAAMNVDTKKKHWMQIKQVLDANE